MITKAKLYIQEGIRDGWYSTVWSYMHDYENSDNPYGNVIFGMENR